MHEITIDHLGLNRHRVIRGPDPEAVQRRADYVKAIWDEQWESRLPAETTRLEQEKAEAEARKQEAQEQVDPPPLAPRQTQSDTVPESDILPKNDAIDRTPPRDNRPVLKKETIRPSKQDFALKSRVRDYLWPFTMRRKTKSGGDPNPEPGLG